MANDVLAWLTTTAGQVFCSFLDYGILVAASIAYDDLGNAYMNLKILFLQLTVLVSCRHGDIQSTGRSSGSDSLEQHATKNVEYYLISDIDDTVAVSHVVATNNRIVGAIRAIGHLFNANDALVGIAPAYAAIQSRFDSDAPNRNTYFVSGMPESLNAATSAASDFLEQNNFVGAYFLRPGTGTGLSTLEFKVQTISNIFDEALAIPNIEPRFILVGDNGEKDVDVYDAISKKYQSRYDDLKIWTFIHKLYEGPPATGLKPGQIPFYTGADFAANIYRRSDEFGRELLSADDLEDILELTRNVLLEGGRKAHYVLPSWSQLTEQDIESLFATLASQQLPESVHALCAEVHKLINARVHLEKILVKIHQE